MLAWLIGLSKLHRAIRADRFGGNIGTQLPNSYSDKMYGQAIGSKELEKQTSRNRTRRAILTVSSDALIINLDDLLY